jgi:hypothetical protein
MNPQQHLQQFTQQQQQQQQMQNQNFQVPLSPEIIQKMLDENQTMIYAIMENQRLGKYKECTQFQSRLHENLMKLASIADNNKKDNQQ